MSVVIARMYHVVDCESVCVICVCVTRDVLKYIVHYTHAYGLACREGCSILLPPTIFTRLLVRDMYRQTDI